MPRPELHFGLFDAYVGDYGAFATHDSKLGDSKDGATQGSSAKGSSSEKKVFEKFSAERRPFVLNHGLHVVLNHGFQKAHNHQRTHQKDQNKAQA